MKIKHILAYTACVAASLAIMVSWKKYDASLEYPSWPSMESDTRLALLSVGLSFVLFGPVVHFMETTDTRRPTRWAVVVACLPLGFLVFYLVVPTLLLAATQGSGLAVAAISSFVLFIAEMVVAAFAIGVLANFRDETDFSLTGRVSASVMYCIATFSKLYVLVRVIQESVWL